jgi:hypothetical protein
MVSSLGISSSTGGTSSLGGFDTAPRLSPKEPRDPHKIGGKTYARIFANDIAKRSIYADAPVFATGSVIVREKLAKPDDTVPELVTVMIKRENGFSRKTGNWEYLTVNPAQNKILKREKKSSCSECHAKAEATDFVFKNYLE